jgi:hypothetical protein
MEQVKRGAAPFSSLRPISKGPSVMARPLYHVHRIEHNAIGFEPEGLRNLLINNI